jgi:hypothetical protein
MTRWIPRIAPPTWSEMLVGSAYLIIIILLVDPTPIPMGVFAFVSGGIVVRALRITR